jgi:hypothetical protein
MVIFFAQYAKDDYICIHQKKRGWNIQKKKMS